VLIRSQDVPLVKMIRVSRRKFRALCAEGIDVQVYHSSSRRVAYANPTSTAKRSPQ